MSTLLVIKKLTLEIGNEYLMKSLKLIDSYLDKHRNAKISTYIEDICIYVYDGPVFLLKVSTIIINAIGGDI